MSLSPEMRGDIAHVRDVTDRILAKDKANYRANSPIDQIVKDLSPNEVGGFSYCRAIDGLAKNDFTHCGLEREISDACAKTLGLTPRGPGSMFMPSFMPHQVSGAPLSRFLGGGGMQTRATYQVGTPAQGGNIVGTELMASSFIEVLRNQTVTGQLGARFLTGLSQNINIPRQNAQTPTYWVGESVAVTEGEATFDQVQLRPHTVGALSRFSRQMLQQATPAIEQLVREDLVEVSALAVDAAALYGTGASGQPTGISNTANVGSVVGGTNGADLTFDILVSLYAAPLLANAPMENLGFAFNAKVKGYLATLKSSTGQYLWSPSQSIAGSIPNQVVGYKYAVSNQLPYTLTKGTSTGNCSMLIFGNWQELLIGEWGVTEIMVNPYDSVGFTTGDVLVRVFQTVDVGLRHVQSFAVMSDGLTPGF